jgi:hypothetical protein
MRRGACSPTNAWDRLRFVFGSTSTTYDYDALGRRIHEAFDNGITGPFDNIADTDYYYNDNWQVFEDRLEGVAKAQYIWSQRYVDALVLRDRDADGNQGNGLEQRHYVQSDANFNVTALLNTSGTVQERYIYEPTARAPRSAAPGARCRRASASPAPTATAAATRA